jgi:hypothetical protein
LWDWITQLAKAGDDLIDRLGIDLKNVGPQGPSSPGLARDLGSADGYYRIIDEFDTGWQMPEVEGRY